MSVVSEFPKWFLLLCLLAGVVYAGALYFRDRFNRTYGTPLAAVLGVFRFIVVSLLAFFLLKPLIKTVNTEKQKPVIVIAQDNSSSITIGADSGFYKTEYTDRIRALAMAFGDDYDVRTFTFGDGVREGIDSLNFSDKVTDYSALTGEIAARFSGTNLGAVILATDGLYNRGASPLYDTRITGIPYYTLALGDTAIHRDLLIADVAHNRIAYLGNKFPVEILVEGRKTDGETTTLTISRQDEVLFTRPIVCTGSRFSLTIPVVLDAVRPGLQRYTISLTGVSNEVTLSNNRRDLFIDVLDNREKILVVAAAPHPDVAAINDALLLNKSYQVETTLEKDFQGNTAGYSVVVFHQLPGQGGNGINLVRNTLLQQVPCLFITGVNTDFKALNELETGFSFQNMRPGQTDAGAAVNSNFNLFTADEATPKLLAAMPPLSLPFGDIETTQGVQAFLYQRIGSIETSKPLIAFNHSGVQKTGLIAGEGIWRWKLAAFQQTQNHDWFNNIITKTVQFLSLKEDRGFFRVQSRNAFPENERVRFDAELYNESYEPVTDREVTMVITNEDGKDFPYTFSPAGNRYRLDAGQLPAGNYTYAAQASNGTRMLKENGEFTVSPLQLESTQTVADHNLLYGLAAATGGRMVLPAAMDSLVGMVRERQDITAVSYENKQLRDLIDYRWLLGLILLLLGAEWLLRKRAGTY